MTDVQQSRPRAKLYASAIIAALLALIALGALLASGFGYRWQWWPLGTAFSMLRWGAYLGIVALVLGALSILLSLVRKSGRTAVVAAAAIIGGTVAFTLPYQWLQQAQSVPRIHDITTDTLDPPAFVAIVPLRREAPNPIDYDYEENARAQQEAYPDITTVVLQSSPDHVFAAAEAAVRKLGWELVAANAAEGRIEATDTTRWFKFKDDVVVRVQSDATATRVDIRSKSRVGKSDVGENAARIRRFRDALTSSL